MSTQLFKTTHNYTLHNHYMEFKIGISDSLRPSKSLNNHPLKIHHNKHTNPSHNCHFPCNHLNNMFKNNPLLFIHNCNGKYQVYKILFNCNHFYTNLNESIDKNGSHQGTQYFQYMFQQVFYSINHLVQHYKSQFLCQYK